MLKIILKSRTRGKRKAKRSAGNEWRKRRGKKGSQLLRSWKIFVFL